MEVLDDASTLERRMMSDAAKKGMPINGSIELLPLCNMSCDMCYVRMDYHDMCHKGGIRSAQEWLEIGKQMKEAGTLFLLLTGGEPLLYEEFQRVYLGLREMGMIITINTNATLIDEKWADFFSKYKPRRINVTLYGSSNETYEKLCHYKNGFDKTMKGIRLLKERGIDVKIGCSATPYNVDDIQDIINIGDKLDIPVRVDTYMMPAQRERDKPYNMQSRLDPITAANVRVYSLKSEMGEEIFQQYRQKCLYEVEHIITENCSGHMSCYAGKCSFTLNWQGEMRPCVVMSAPKKNVFEEGFMNSWEYIKDEVSHILLSAKCNACHLKTLCRTCGASALLETGDYQGTPKYMCDYTKETLRLLKKEY